jgi:hypothetical protein
MTSPGGFSTEEVKQLVHRYRAGRSIRELVDAYKLPYTTMRRALLYAGVDLRPRGGDHRWHKKRRRKLSAVQATTPRPGPLDQCSLRVAGRAIVQAVAP